MARSEKSEVSRYSDAFWTCFITRVEKRNYHSSFVGHCVGTNILVHRNRLAISEYHDRSINIGNEPRDIHALGAHVNAKLY